MPIQDDSELRDIIQQMIDAKVPEKDIGATIERYRELHEPVKPGPPQTISEPTDFWGGVRNSLSSGDAMSAGLTGAAGFAHGAILDLPSTIANTANTAAGLMSFGSPSKQVETAKGVIDSFGQLPSHIAETTSKASSEPYAFGRMMGQLTGQPAATEGLIKVAPKIPVKTGIRKLGGPVSTVGTGVIAVSPFMPWGTRLKTFGAGYGLKKVGDYMSKVGTSDPGLMSSEVGEFWGKNTPQQPKPTLGGTTVINPSDPFSRTPLIETPMTDIDALKQFYGGQKIAPPPPDAANVVNPSDPFSRTSLPESLLSPKNAAPTAGDVLGGEFNKPIPSGSLAPETAQEPHIPFATGAEIPQELPFPPPPKPRISAAEFAAKRDAKAAPPPPPKPPKPNAKTLKSTGRPIMQHSPSNPGYLRGSLDGGQTWRYSTDGGNTFTANEPGSGPSDWTKGSK